MELMGAVGPLQRVTLMLNSETNLRTLKRVNRERRKQTGALREAIRELSKDPDGNETKMSEKTERRITIERGSVKSTATLSTLGCLPTDLLPIKLTRVSVGYKPSDPVLQHISVVIPQGSLVAVVGPHGHGKATFLRLLAGQLLPQKGEVFIATHLRVLQVHQDPMVLDLTLFENLTFGEKGADRERVVRIMRRLDLDRLVAELDEPLSVWINHSTSTEITAIHLARALVANPEVLVLHRPLLNFDDTSRAKILEILHDYVESRGVELPEAELAKRRLRTCIMSTASKAAALSAAMVLKVEEKGVTEVTSGVADLDYLDIS